MVNWKKYSKSDKENLVRISILNRNHLYTLSAFVFSAMLSSLALVISTSQTNPLVSSIVILVIIIVGMIGFTLLINSADKFNKQYQEIHKTMHPELLKKGSGFIY